MDIIDNLQLVQEFASEAGYTPYGIPRQEVEFAWSVPVTWKEDGSAAHGRIGVIWNMGQFTVVDVAYVYQLRDRGDTLLSAA